VFQEEKAMKRPLLICAVMALMFQAIPVRAAESVFLSTGAQWIRLPQEEKFKVVFASIVALDEAGVPFTKSPNHYILLIDLLLAGYPELLGEDPANLLAAIVYKYEPESRAPLILARERWETERLERQLLRSYTGIPTTE
jgi:hypothetical protein